jgi:predicted transcriptional regulator
MAKSRGRPTSLNARVQKIIVDTIRMGATFEAAAGRAGVSVASINEWRWRGRDPEDKSENSRLYAAFYEAIQRALSDAETSLVTTIRDASEKNWTAAAWLLERRIPDSYGRRDRIEHSGGLENTTRADPSIYTKDELEQIARAHKAALARKAKPK